MSPFKKRITIDLYDAVRKNVSFDVRSQVDFNVYRSVYVIVHGQVFWPIFKELDSE